LFSKERRPIITKKHKNNNQKNNKMSGDMASVHDPKI